MIEYLVELFEKDKDRIKTEVLVPGVWELSSQA